MEDFKRFTKICQRHRQGQEGILNWCCTCVQKCGLIVDDRVEGGSRPPHTTVRTVPYTGTKSRRSGGNNIGVSRSIITSCTLMP